MNFLEQLAKLFPANKPVRPVSGVRGPRGCIGIITTDLGTLRTCVLERKHDGDHSDSLWPPVQEKWS